MSHWISTAHRIVRPLLSLRGFKLDESRPSIKGGLGLWRWSLDSSKSKQKPKRRLVVIPGFLDSTLSWMTLLSFLPVPLRRKWDEVVVVEFPGYPGYLLQETPYASFDQMKQEVFELLDTLQPQAILGHSLGGWLAAAYAGEKAAGVHRNPKELYLITPAGAFSDEESKERWQRRFEVVLKKGFEGLRPYLFRKEPLWFQWVVPEVQSLFDRPELMQFIRSFRDEHRVEPILERIDAQVTMIWADSDTQTPAAWALAWLRPLAKKQEPTTYLLKRVGHTVHVEKPIVLGVLLSQIWMGKDLPLKGLNPFWQKLRPKELVLAAQPTIDF